MRIAMRGCRATFGWRFLSTRPPSGVSDTLDPFSLIDSEKEMLEVEAIGARELFKGEEF
jgi:hypothetical protein